jgi:hypothetical protein
VHSDCRHQSNHVGGDRSGKQHLQTLTLAPQALLISMLQNVTDHGHLAIERNEAVVHHSLRSREEEALA